MAIAKGIKEGRKVDPGIFDPSPFFIPYQER